MSETRELLARISALRQRLEQAQGLMQQARALASESSAEPVQTLTALTQEVRAGTDSSNALDTAVRPITGAEPLQGSGPRQLTARARRVLERGRELLGQLRALTDPTTSNLNDLGPLTYLYRDTVAMIDTALRTVSLLPDSATAQMQLCTGLEVTLQVVEERLATLQFGANRQAQQEQHIEWLADLLVRLHAGEAVQLDGLYDLAEQLLAEVRECEPLSFLEEHPSNLPWFVACHSLTVARIVARVIGQEPQLRTRSREAIVVALLHDLGMLDLNPDILSSPEPLKQEDRRHIESHVLTSASRVSERFPNDPWLAEAVAGHHERLDGTGYPDGLKGVRIHPLARLLAVCDVYAALCCHRPHRPARGTRTALADTLLLADQGALDRFHAECLLSLSFYPIGSVVELAHGEVGIVVATPKNGTDLSLPARPVVELLTDSEGKTVAVPRHIDLARAEHHSIVRQLDRRERQELLARRFPRWAA